MWVVKELASQFMIAVPLKAVEARCRTPHEQREVWGTLLKSLETMISQTCQAWASLLFGGPDTIQHYPPEARMKESQ